MENYKYLFYVSFWFILCPGKLCDNEQVEDCFQVTLLSSVMRKYLSHFPLSTEHGVFQEEGVLETCAARFCMLAFYLKCFYCFL